MLRIAVNHKTREFWTNCVSPALPVISAVLFPEYYVIAALKSSSICGVHAIPAVAGTKQNYVRATLVVVRINTQSSGALYGKISQQHIIKCRLLDRAKRVCPSARSDFAIDSVRLARYQLDDIVPLERKRKKKKTYSETGKIPTSSFTRIHGVPPTRVTRFGLRIGVRVGTIVHRVGKGQGNAVKSYINRSAMCVPIVWWRTIRSNQCFQICFSSLDLWKSHWPLKIFKKAF